MDPEVRINLVAVRANAGMNQDEWAKALGVDKGTICRWEKGRTIPNAAYLIKMSELSGIPVANIFLPIENENSVFKGHRGSA